MQDICIEYHKVGIGKKDIFIEYFGNQNIKTKDIKQQGIYIRCSK